MKTKVQLSNASVNMVYWEDVNVSRGVYFTKGNDVDVRFISGDIENGYEITCAENSFRNGKIYKTLADIILYMGDGWECFTISNKRVTIEKKLTEDNLKDTDHVGFVSGGVKWEVINENGGLNAVSEQNVIYRSMPQTNHTMLFQSWATEIYLFTTRKELYQWLAE
jgi:hypothetical protein